MGYLMNRPFCFFLLALLGCWLRNYSVESIIGVSVVEGKEEEGEDFDDWNDELDNVVGNESLGASQKCYEWTGSSCSWEPNLLPMIVSFPSNNPNIPEEETFYAYIDPEISTLYNQSEGTRTIVKPSFTGIFGKFINFSPDTVKVWWKGQNQGDWGYIADIEPFGSAGTATYFGHEFVLTPAHDKSKILIVWKIRPGNSLYYYDPFKFNILKAHKALTAQQYIYYHMQWHNKIFADQYRVTTGRDWLALYKQKLPPRFHMWRADFFGQTHQVVTKEIHFVEMPDKGEMDRGASAYGPRPDVLSRLRRHRHELPTLTLNLTVLSCRPRVFEILNFLSDTEINHLLDVARKSDLHRSSVSAGDSSEADRDSDTRTSTNSWIPRNTDVVTDALYRRAADVLHMDEALLRWRRASEIPEFVESTISVAERLQCVNYQVGQQYNAHHDFTMPNLINLQPSRFATILFYLNDVEEGGETSFPRWINAETSGPLNVKPQRGKAVLFYSLLPDGNYDDLSQHAALPVIKGEKWLINLWIWDPVMDHRNDFI